MSQWSQTGARLLESYLFDNTAARACGVCMRASDNVRVLAISGADYCCNRLISCLDSFTSSKVLKSHKAPKEGHTQILAQKHVLRLQSRSRWKNRFYLLLQVFSNIM